MVLYIEMSPQSPLSAKGTAIKCQTIQTVDRAFPLKRGGHDSTSQNWKARNETVGGSEVRKRVSGSIFSRPLEPRSSLSAESLRVREARPCRSSLRSL